MTPVVRDVLALIKGKPGLYTSQVVDLHGGSRRDIEDAIWVLWRDGAIQMESDSTLRLTREGEKVFRHFAP